MRLLITGPFEDGVLSDLEHRGFQLIRRGANASPEELKAALRDADAYILGGNEMLTTDLVSDAPKLRIVVFLGEQPETFMGSGTERMLQEKGIRLESTPAVSTEGVAEMACALILCTLRRIPYLVDQVRSGGWPSVTGGELAGKTLGIYGMGRIGYTVAKRLTAFDLMGILYSDIVPSERGEKDLGAKRVDLEELFAESDAISIHAPLTPQTRGIAGEDLLRRMKRSAVLVNTARAGIVDPNALRTALEQGWLACAAFDGYYVEGPELMRVGDPHGLLEMRDRFFATSHQAFNTYEALRNASEMAANKITSFFAGSPPQTRAA